MKKILLTICVFVFVATSCNKDDDEETPPAITLQNIAGNYKVVASNFTYLSTNENLLSQWDTCAKDDVITFNANKSYTWPDVGIKCSVTTDQNGSWDLPRVNKFLWDTDLYDLDNFDGRSLEISQSVADSLGRIATFTWRFQKQ